MDVNFHLMGVIMAWYEVSCNGQNQNNETNYHISRGRRTNTKPYYLTVMMGRRRYTLRSDSNDFNGRFPRLSNSENCSSAPLNLSTLCASCISWLWRDPILGSETGTMLEAVAGGQRGEDFASAIYKSSTTWGTSMGFTTRGKRFLAFSWTNHDTNAKHSRVLRAEWAMLRDDPSPCTVLWKFWS